MSIRRYIQISAVIAAFILIAMVWHAWLAAHDEQLRMQAVIKTQSQVIEAANAREQSRAVDLNQTLAEIAKLKHETQTPQQILQQLPKYLQLPQPITMGQSGDANQRVAGEASTQSHLGTGGQIRADEEGSRVSSKSRPPKVLNSLVGKFDAVRRVFEGRAAPGADNASSRANRSEDLASDQAQNSESQYADGAQDDGSIAHGHAASAKKTERELPEAPLRTARDIARTRFSCIGASDSSDPKNAQNSSTVRDCSPGASSGGSADEGSRYVRSAVNTGDTDILSAKNPSQIREAQTNAKPPSANILTANPGTLSSGSAEIPAADIKPLYDYVQDCRACQAQLSAAKQDQLDDIAKLAALTRERDVAVTAAKGGTLWRRLRRNAAWFAVGAATGVAFAAAAHHATP
jgi:hypothetical protein